MAQLISGSDVIQPLNLCNSQLFETDGIASLKKYMYLSYGTGEAFEPKY